MNLNIYTLFVEKKREYNLEAEELLLDLRENLGIVSIESLRVVNRYDVSGISKDDYEKVKEIVFSEKTVDMVSDEFLNIDKEEKVFSVRYLPGQFDQRADSAIQCMQIITGQEAKVLTSKVIVIKGTLGKEEFQKIKDYYINKVDSSEVSLQKPNTLDVEWQKPKDIKIMDNFIDMKEDELKALIKQEGYAMLLDDLKFVQGYFKEENRNPYVTEMKVIDTYWSDHCRHTTFQTVIDDVHIEEGEYSKAIEDAYDGYLKSREYVYGDRKKEVCLMDIAVIAAKELRKRGLLDDLDQSEEINACSINIKVDVEGNEEDWLLMFKNETHNHPTEIEPFGGAATCIGGAIRDPLSGRTYVYQAMRVTGSGDPRTPIKDTLEGKLPQRKITLGAAHGYSSYGNQIGLATGMVSEVYHKDYVAKRMEVGAVIAAAPKENVVRETPKIGDIIVLLGGRTGRDGCGGATGSSKEHTEESINKCSSEVQKGNAPTERKLQRLFRNPNVSKMIKRCNDFGAGGVSVAIGELCDGLFIDLDKVPKKYEGLDGTELAISESQERMAVVIRKEDEDKFLNYAKEENLEAVVVAKVTEDRRLKMNWRGNTIVDLSREFLDTNGVKAHTKVKVVSPSKENNFFKNIKNKRLSGNFKNDWINLLKDLNICSQKGLVERFDSTIGAGTVLMPFGGKYQDSEEEGMVAKIPVLNKETTTASIMTYGFNPELSKWSPFHGGIYAVVESMTKLVCLGGDFRKIRLTFQEYFERLNNNEEKWGKPFAALIGALKMQREFEIAAIGGKDSMSGTFKDIDVPPTLISFAVGITNIDKVTSREFKRCNSKVVLIEHKMNEDFTPNVGLLKGNFLKVQELIEKGKVLSSSTVSYGGIAEAITKMCLGNRIGMALKENIELEKLFSPIYGSIILEINEEENLQDLFKDVKFKVLGTTIDDFIIRTTKDEINLNEVLDKYNSVLEGVFKTKAKEPKGDIYTKITESKTVISPKIKIVKPKVFIPVFPGTNCEYDSARAFIKEGAEVETKVFRNRNWNDIEESIEEFKKAIDSSNIVMLPGGFSAGDEPDGSGKFIAAVFRNEKLKESIMELLNNRDGLMLGICNGFQALIKLGLVPYGEIIDIKEDSPTLTYNNIGRHISKIVYTKVISNKSPWLRNTKVEDVHSIAVSHGEGKFVCSNEMAIKLMENGQVATQYVDLKGNGTYDINFNPNGSVFGIEGITSLDGRVLGKMGHSERKGNGVFKNIIGEKEQGLFKSGVEYFK